MNQAIVLALAIYLMIVGWKGNAGELNTAVATDGPKFVPVLAALIVLLILRSTRLKPLVEPFLVLAALAYITKHWPAISADTKQTIATLSTPAPSKTGA